MLKRPSECSTCVLDENQLCQGYAPPFGRGGLKVLVVAEALGEQEAREGRPLVPKAQAGSVFARALKILKLDEDQCKIVNTINCRPPGNRLEGEWYEDAAIDHCRRYIDKVVDEFKPRAILTLGNVALRSQTGLSGAGLSVTALRGYCLPSQWYRDSSGASIPVIGTYHPSFIARGQEKFLGVVVHDISKAIRVASGQLVEGRDFYFEPSNHIGVGKGLEYIYDPNEAYLEYLLDRSQDPEALIAYDIETDYTGKAKGEDTYELAKGDNIVQIQFSVKPGQAFILPWNSNTKSFSGRMLDGPAMKIAHNAWRFDDIKLREQGIEIGGLRLDSMTAFHHIQPDLPADLQFMMSLYGGPFPWKHFGNKDMIYGGADVDNLQRAFPKLKTDMLKRGVWESYLEYVVGLQPVLERMQDHGIRIDLGAREEFRKEIEIEKAQASRILQTQVPPSIKPIEVYIDWPEKAKSFVNEIAAANVIVGPKGGKKLPVMKLSGATADHHLLLTEAQREGLLATLGENWGIDKSDKLYRTDDFLPNSTAHMKKLILAYGEPVPKNLDDDETTERPALEELVEKLRIGANKIDAKKRKAPEDFDRVQRKLHLAEMIETSITYRKMNKMGSTYIDGWKIGEDGAVHTKYTFKPATWQLSSVDPNVQNGPAHGALAAKFQKLQIASPGCTLIAADYGGCHLKTLAFEMGDLNYYRMARIDGHSTIGLFALKIITPEKLFEKTDQEWRELCEWFRTDPDRERKRQKQFKPALLGIQLGLMGKKLYDNNKDNFSNSTEAQSLIDLIKGIYPSVPKWQQYNRDLAHRQHFLLSNYGGIRWFWSVYRWDARLGKMVGGEDAEAALAYPVQNDAFGKKRESMLDLAASGLDRKYQMNNDIHDASYFDCPNQYLDEALHTIKTTMESPARRLKSNIWPEGLVIDVELKIGPNLGELKKVKI